MKHTEVIYLFCLLKSISGELVYFALPSLRVSSSGIVESFPKKYSSQLEYVESWLILEFRITNFFSS